MAEQERSLQLKRPGGTLRFAKNPWGDVWGSAHSGGRAPMQIAFAIARNDNVRMTERDEDCTAAVWIGNAAFDLRNCEVERVREFFGLPVPEDAPATPTDGAPRHA